MHSFTSNTALRAVSALAVYGPLLVTACEHAPQSLRVWSLEASGPKAELLTTHETMDTVAALALSVQPDSTLIISAGADDEVTIWGPTS